MTVSSLKRILKTRGHSLLHNINFNENSERQLKNALEDFSLRWYSVTCVRSASIGRDCQRKVNKSRIWMLQAEKSAFQFQPTKFASSSTDPLSKLEVQLLEEGKEISETEHGPNSSQEAKSEPNFEQVVRHPHVLEFDKTVRPWEELTTSFQNFPHYMSDSLKKQILTFGVCHMKFPHLSNFGGSLLFSSSFILLQGAQGTEEYQELLAEALANEFKANLMVVSGRFVSPMDEEDSRDPKEDWEVRGEPSSELDDVSDDVSEDENEEEEDEEEEEEEIDFEGENEGEKKEVGNGVWVSKGSEERKVLISPEVAFTLKTFLEGLVESSERNGALGEGKGGKSWVFEWVEKNFPGELEGVMENWRNGKPLVYILGENSSGNDQEASSSSSSSSSLGSEKPPWFGVKRGDRVQFKGERKGAGGDWFSVRLENGQFLWVHKSTGVEFPGDGGLGRETNKGSEPLTLGREGKVLELSSTCPGSMYVEWDLRVGEIEAQRTWTQVFDLDLLEKAESVLEADIRTQALFQVVEEQSARGPLVVLMKEASDWLLNVVPTHRSTFLERIEGFQKALEGRPLLFLGSCPPVPPETKDEKSLGPIMTLYRSHEKALRASGLSRIFPDCLQIPEPKSGHDAARWREMIGECRNRALAEQNRGLLSQILQKHNLACPGGIPDITSETLSPRGAEHLVGLAKAMALSVAENMPPVSQGVLHLSPQSFTEALNFITSLNPKPSVSREALKELLQPSPDSHEQSLLSEVVLPTELGVTFADVAALEDAKCTLREVVSLPLSRPELFLRGSLAKPVSGVLLFGPPGTGKTLLAKALASEAGASFISLTSSAITSKWYGDAERRVKALFSLARKLAPCVIFVDEVDSLLGARGGPSEHEATRKLRNEFMAAWDGLRSSDDPSLRVLLLGATNRPFDLDEAVIRRLPRRIMIGLPDEANRVKILEKMLEKEELESGFQVRQLAKMTEGYSGSDLKNLCVAAAYRPIREFLKREEGHGPGVKLSSLAKPPILRPIELEDFKQALSQVGASVSKDSANITELNKWNEMYGEKGSRRKKSMGFLDSQL